ncbi:glycoside hydrolase family 3 C-terminal domain-containing protein [Neobacillus cucumis]|uniref:glycoside hydrolase family 3 C-terminal domain-containing protein n=1 Tax=Neobacillus cucumis TaxID=1740721 RepID=UPI002E1BF682|nr:glycoside hydrolase family 3 C-terminal domain-containing protein [Neobacillus cucumis]MED4229044.1 glycoside hydrolase family 3 C-terminal domain-containing protein [Neobacillus cucumis]
MSANIKELINEMTLEEKAGLCSGLDFWNTKGIERLGIPSIMMTDGPHGLRKQEGDADHLGINKSIPSTCFPSAAGLACSWDKDMLNKVGAAIGEECQAENVSIILGPGANIKRSPLCGRNFEYFSEDPYLSSKLAANYIKGVQCKGIGTSLKHFAVNNQEYNRMSIDAVVDERTLREIYLASFEEAVKEGQPWTVMAAYNKVNGEYCSENKKLLTEILKDEWGFNGLVVSDWGAVNERDLGLAAGLELEMPTSGGIGEDKIIEAVRQGKLSEKVLDQAVERILKILFKSAEYKQENAYYSKEDHHALAREVARESMVLLKNEDHILPIKEVESVAVIGAFAQSPRYQGGGSSHINPTKVDNIYEELTKMAGKTTSFTYSEGYDLESDEVNESLIEEAVQAAKQASVAVIFAGLPERYESEGFDRKHLLIPDNHRFLIEAVAEVQSNVIVVLSNGAPIEMPWLDKVKGVLEGYLGGQALGGAIADILFGSVSPSGKLAETFPKKLVHNPSYLHFPGDGESVEYREGIFVGYRHYDTRDVEPLFPFGYGLSYTSFEYSGLQVDKKQIKDDDTIMVTVKIKNTGSMAGKEVVQLYIRDVESTMPRPEKELKGFEKVSLQPGEETTVTFELAKRAFAYYNVKLKDWHVETGTFELLVGKSSRDILLKETVEVESTVIIKKVLTRNSTFGDLLEHPIGAEIMKAMGQGQFEGQSSLGAGMQEMILGTTLHNASIMSNGQFTEETLQGILQAVNKSN